MWFSVCVCWLSFDRPARSQDWPESPDPRRQLSAGPRGQRVLEGTSSLHLQRLQVHCDARRPLLQPWALFWSPAVLALFFSALLYLNGDFEGGEFIFTEMDAKTVTVSRFSTDTPASNWSMSFPLATNALSRYDMVAKCDILKINHFGFYVLPPPQASVKPKCGRMVGFSSGGENPHGVKAVTGGQRCAIALWFTLDPLFRELVMCFQQEMMQGFFYIL